MNADIRKLVDKLKAALAGSSPEIRQTTADEICPEGKKFRERLLQEVQHEAGRRNALQRQLDIDSLTGAASNDALTRALPAAEKDPTVAVLVFDGDNLKQLNDIEGHVAGDLILKEISRSICAAIEEVQIPERVFRRGNHADEFVALTPKEVAIEVIELAEQKFGMHTYAGVKVGFTGGWGDTFVEADAAMRQAKRRRKMAPPSKSDL